MSELDSLMNSLIDEHEQQRLAEAIRRRKLTHRQLEKEMGRKLTAAEAFGLTQVILRPRFYISPVYPAQPIGKRDD